MIRRGTPPCAARRGMAMRRGGIITCHDLAMAGLWNQGDCCVSCHDDDDQGPNLGPATVPPNKHWRDSGYEFALCCACAMWLDETAMPLRDIVARVLWTRHEIERWRGETD